MMIGLAAMFFPGLSTPARAQDDAPLPMASLVTGAVSDDARTLFCHTGAAALDEQGSTLPDPAQRAAAVDTAWRMRQRLSRLPARFAHPAPGTIDKDAARIINQVLADHVRAEPAIEPHVLIVRELGELGKACAGWLDHRRLAPLAPAERDDHAPDIVRLGYAEFRLSGRRAADIFGSTPAAVLARTLCAPAGHDAATLSREIAAFVAANGGKAALDRKVGPDDHGQSLLGWSVACANPVAASALLDAGADANLDLGHGDTAVGRAAALRDPAVLVTLLAHGGKAEGHDARHTFLENAWLAGHAGGHYAGFDAMIAAGADPDHLVAGIPALWDVVIAEQGWHWLAEHWSLVKDDKVALALRIEQFSENTLVPPDMIPDYRAVFARLKTDGVCLPIRLDVEYKTDAKGHLIQPDCPTHP
ncbi:hypothetical protein Y88_1714 [Novosphingobium nitrogenifigens DSM 19370]|uniref:Uncharacterized protein n=1 Tax=Novosphingobium nitrogenifigens DSM 19370 TaxID=983920 RepID=F1Z3L2_9SPHN|nr:hypothetical protein Y88_1714 [Novosphingobium nitrogenifigens DSM 19370]